ncbi:MAG: hypothetical protein EZS28_025685 [Streblomastix strix]|uniref:MULE transposase domain-containing protein n=1 Tax=Streblomastix strix TaxID=222440 RepID=A0A5J4V8H3_9EUKA|nr:MAG: hypothetical protein EZS28_025685 [Streblomastix strix]
MSRNRISELLKGQLVCITMDQATIQHSKYLFVMISNPLISLNPFLIALLLGIQSQEEFSNVAHRLILKLKFNQITITSFVTDGLPAQANALSLHYSELMELRVR